MKGKRKPTHKHHRSSHITDLEVARKMLKIFQSAQDRGLHFDLSFQTVKELLSHPTCYYTGRRFEEEGQFSRSFDRIDSDQGYIEGNVVSCTVDINSKKSNLTYEEIQTIYEKLTVARKMKEKEPSIPQNFNTEEIFCVEELNQNNNIHENSETVSE
jgi:hypothetical protein